MTQKVNAQDIKIGMFIADLDRPWIDTPFLLQGFLVEDEDQLQQLNQHCKWVLIDPQRSVGPEFDAPIKKTAAVPRDLGTEPRVTINRVATPVSAHAPGKTPAASDPRPAAAAPSAKASRPDPTRAGTREFAVSVKDSRTNTGNPAFRPLESAGAARHAGGANAGAVPNSRGLWGKLREGVSGLYSRQHFH